MKPVLTQLVVVCLALLLTISVTGTPQVRVAGGGVFPNSPGMSAYLGISPTAFQPALNTSWQWQIGTVFNTATDFITGVQMYDIDGFDNPASTVTSIHGQNAKAVCYLSAGTFENFRSDAASFPASVKGNVVSGFTNENWLDTRQIPVLAPIMNARFDMCKTKGFDGVEADNIDGYQNNTGFPLTYRDSLNYAIYLSGAAHSRGLTIAFKNDIGQLADAWPFFDYALNEQCNQFNECANLTTYFINNGKAVFQVEYSLATTAFCPADNTANFNGLKKTTALNSTRTPCRGP